MAACDAMHQRGGWTVRLDRCGARARRAWVCALWAGLLAGLPGCDTYAVRVKQDKAVLARLTEVTVRWTPNPDITINVTRKAPVQYVYTKDSKKASEYVPPQYAVVTDYDRRGAADDTRKVAQLYAAKVEERLAIALSFRQVQVKPAGASGVVLRLQPSSSFVDCEYTCSMAFWVKAQLLVGPQAREAWSADIRTTAGSASRIDERMLAQFEETLLKNLKESGLI